MKICNNLFSDKIIVVLQSPGRIFDTSHINMRFVGGRTETASFEILW